MLEAIHKHVESGQGLTPDQAKFLLAMKDEIFTALKHSWARELRKGRIVGQVRKRLRAAARVWNGPQPKSSEWATKLADSIDGRRNRKFR